MMVASSADNEQCDARDDVEYKDDALVKRDPADIQQVQLLRRKPGEPAPKSVKPIAPEQKEHGPNDEDRVVDDRAPQEEAASRLNGHFETSLGCEFVGSIEANVAAASRVSNRAIVTDPPPPRCPADLAAGFSTFFPTRVRLAVPAD
jgi:hypothetical protein